MGEGENSEEDTEVVTPDTSETISGVQTFSFNSNNADVDGDVAELELDIYLDNTRTYSEHLGIKLTADVDEYISELFAAITLASPNNDTELAQALVANSKVGESNESKWMSLEKAENYVLVLKALGLDLSEDDNGKSTVGERLSFESGVWNITLDTAKLTGVTDMEFLVSLNDGSGNRLWGENNFNLPDADEKAFSYTVNNAQ